MFLQVGAVAADKGSGLVFLLDDAQFAGEVEYRSAKLGRETTEVSVIRQRLLDKGLIYATEDYGYVDFTVPRFHEFMTRYMPYRPPRPPRKKRTN